MLDRVLSAFTKLAQKDIKEGNSFDFLMGLIHLVSEEILMCMDEIYV